MSHPRLAMALLPLFCSGCFFVPNIPTAALPAAGPALSPNSEAVWKQLEGAAADAATAAGASSRQQPKRLRATGFAVEHALQVKGGHCYVAALAWSSRLKTQVSTRYGQGAGGKEVNEQVPGQRYQFARSAGVVQFCADNDGPTQLTITATGAHGAVVTNELLEYALVVGSRPETRAQTQARHLEESAQMSNVRAQRETDVELAEMKRKKDLERRCARCREDLALCRAEAAARRKYPRKGITVSTPCARQFHDCSHPNKSQALSNRNKWPCGQP